MILIAFLLLLSTYLNAQNNRLTIHVAALKNRKEK